MRVSMNGYNGQPATNFGNVVASEKSIEYLNKNLNPKQIKKVNQIIREQEGKEPNILLRVGTYITSFLNRHTETPFLQAEVLSKTYTDRWFRSPFGVIKSAAKYADSFEGEAEIRYGK